MRKNLLDNMLWRGDKDFSLLPFGEVDALILSVLIYQRFEDVENYGEGMTLKELYPIVCPLPIELTTGFDTNRYKLWAKVAQSKRFSSLTLSRFAYSLSSERQNEEQFGAAVFKGDSLPDILIYRGTDESITGWKEDLNLGFEDEIPSERKALSFLEEIAPNSDSIIIAGHSKGGTLALYSALKAEEITFNKIERIYSFDAPGLPEEMTETPRWQAVTSKTESYLPSYSIFGVLFNTIPDPKVVKSDGIGVFQHDAFTWKIEEETFIYDRDLSIRSKLHGESLRSFFTSSTRKEREILVEAIYKVLSSVKENNVFHIPVVIIEHLDLFTKEIASLSKEEKVVVKKLLGTIRKARKRRIQENKGTEQWQKERRKKKTWLKVLLLGLSLVVIFLVLCYITPSESEVGLESTGYIDGLEIPIGPNDEIIVSHTGYTLSYSEEYEVPYWVAYSLTREEVITQTAERKDNFRPDELIPTDSASLNDYKKSGYDRGHMAPAADFKWSEEAMSDTFYLSNMCPQVHSFNAGIWSDLESAVRSIAYTDGEVYVVTGPVLTDGPYETIGENNVAVPKYFYKVILDYTDPVIKAIGFIMPNENSSEPLSYFAMSVDEVEEITQIDFFPALPDDIEDVVEAEFDPSLWALRSFSISSEEINTEAIEYTSGTTVSSSDDSVTYLIELFNTTFYSFKKEVFNALGITKYMRTWGFI